MKNGKIFFLTKNFSTKFLTAPRGMPSRLYTKYILIFFKYYFFNKKEIFLFKTSQQFFIFSFQNFYFNFHFKTLRKIFHRNQCVRQKFLMKNIQTIFIPKFFKGNFQQVRVVYAKKNIEK